MNFDLFKHIREATKDDPTFKAKELTQEEMLKKAKPTLDIIRDAMASDDEPGRKQQFWIEKAIEEKNIDDLLIAICGYSWETLQQMRLESVGEYKDEL